MIRTVRNLLLVALLLAAPMLAQDTAEDEAIPTETGIYVTTQDFLNLRSGPGTNFEALQVIDPEVTLMAIGRSADTRWVQVITDEGVTGWLFVRFLVYSGDVVQLRVDGINPETFIRMAGVVAFTTRVSPVYDREGNVIRDAYTGRMELTGRLGSGNFARYQFYENGIEYWISAYNVRITSGNPSRLFDTAYLYPYGRILRQLDLDISATLGSLDQIEAIWRGIGNGASVNCTRIPRRITRGVTDVDVQQEALFSPSVIALDAAILNTNAAISAFEDACARAQAGESEFVTLADVRNALARINDARLNLNITDSTYIPLQGRDPLARILSGRGQ